METTDEATRDQVTLDLHALIGMMANQAAWAQERGWFTDPHIHHLPAGLLRTAAAFYGVAVTERAADENGAGYLTARVLGVSLFAEVAS